MWTHPIFNFPQWIMAKYILGATRSWVWAAVALAGSLLSAKGAKDQGNANAAANIAQARGAMFQGAVGDFNAAQLSLDAEIAAQNSRLQAQGIIRSATDQAKNLREAGRQLEGQQRVAYAKSGVRMSGTPLEVMAQSAANVEMDAVNLSQEALFNSDNLIKSGEFQAAQLRTQSQFESLQAKQSRISAGYYMDAAGVSRRAGNISAGSSLLGGVAAAGSMFSK